MPGGQGETLYGGNKGIVHAWIGFLFGILSPITLPAHTRQLRLSVIPDVGSDPAAGGTGPFKPQMAWMPDQVRHDGQKQKPKERCSILFSY
jgi:hypothetical protein